MQTHTGTHAHTLTHTDPHTHTHTHVRYLGNGELRMASDPPSGSYTKVSVVNVYGVPPTKSIEALTLLHTPSTGQVHSTAGRPQPCVAIKMKIKLDWVSVTKIVT